MTILDTIVAQKRREIAKLSERTIAAGDLRDALLERNEPRDFLAALRKPAAGDVALIAEVKKASPSAGVIRPAAARRWTRTLFIGETGLPGRRGVKRWARLSCPSFLTVLSIQPKQSASSTASL